MDALVTPVAWAIAATRGVLSPLTGPDAGITWLLAIVLVALVVRLVLLPLSARQFHTQVTSQKAQPELSAVTRKYSLLQKEVLTGDLSEKDKMEKRAELQRSQLADVKTIQKSHGLQFRGFLVPLVVQLFVGLGVYRVLLALQDGTRARFGLSEDTLTSAAGSTLLGNPLSTPLLSFSEGLFPQSTGATLWVLPVLVVATALVSALGIHYSFRRSAQTRRFLGQEPSGSSFQTVLPWVLLPLLACTYALLPLGLLANIAVVLLVTLLFQVYMVKRHLAPSPQTI